MNSRKILSLWPCLIATLFTSNVSLAAPKMSAKRVVTTCVQALTFEEKAKQDLIAEIFGNDKPTDSDMIMINNLTRDLEAKVKQYGPAAIKHVVIQGAGDVVNRFYVMAFIQISKKYNFDVQFFDFAKIDPTQKLNDIQAALEGKRQEIKAYIETSGYRYWNKATPEGAAAYKKLLTSKNGPGGKWIAAIATKGSLHEGLISELQNAVFPPEVTLGEKPFGDSIEMVLNIMEPLEPYSEKVKAIDHYPFKMKRSAAQEEEDLKFLGGGLSEFEFIMTEDRSGGDPTMKNSLGRDGSIENEGRNDALREGEAADLAIHGKNIIPLWGDLHTLTWGKIKAAQYEGVDGDPKKRAGIPKETFFSGEIFFKDKHGNMVKGKIIVGKGVRTRSYGAEYEHSAKLVILWGLPNAKGQRAKMIFDLRSTGEGSPSKLTHYDAAGNVVGSPEDLEKFPYTAMFEEYIAKGKSDRTGYLEQALTARQKLAEGTRRIGVGSQIPGHEGGMAPSAKMPNGRQASYIEDLDRDLPVLGGPGRVKGPILPKGIPGDRDFAVIGIGNMGIGVLHRGSDPTIGGFKVAANDIHEETAQKLKDTMTPNSDYIFRTSLAETVASLSRARGGRLLMLQVTNQNVTDIVLSQLENLLEPGDCVFDGGNNNYKFSRGWAERLAKKGILLMDGGVSGGVDGAWNGQAMMVGGNPKAWAMWKPILEKMELWNTDIKDPSIKHSTIQYVGPSGAGHFVKMMHNGDEYTHLQTLREVDDILGNVLHYNNDQISETLSHWNEGELNTFLLGADADALKQIDQTTGKHWVDLLLPIIEQKGTGSWAAIMAFEAQVFAPSLSVSVQERLGTTFYPDRARYEGLVPRHEATPLTREDTTELLEDLPKALYAARLISFIETMDALKAGSNAFFDGKIDMVAATQSWRTGSILVGKLLEIVHAAYVENPDLESVLWIPHVQEKLKEYMPSLYRIAFKYGAPQNVRTPEFVTLYNSIQRYNLPEVRNAARDIQATRNRFGGHPNRLEDEDHDKIYTFDQKTQKGVYLYDDALKKAKK